MKLFILVALSIWLGACTSLDKGENKTAVTVGKSLSANQYSNIYFSGQPGKSEYQPLKDDGFALILNLRDPSEYDESEEMTLVKKTGMEYVNVPFKSTTILNDDFISEVTKHIAKHRKKGNILVHCSSGNRAGIWAGGHFFKDHEYSKSKSIEMSKKLGITSTASLEKLQTYLDSK